MSAQLLTDWALNVRTFRLFETCCPAHDPLIPALSGFETFYRVKVSAIGEDGDLVALGHVGKLRALAAFNRVAREVWGERDLYDSVFGVRPDRIVDRIEHRWMTNDAPADDWLMRSAKEGDFGAFPVTYWSA